MPSPPLLLSSAWVLPPQLQSLPHVVGLTNNLLTPATIDAAVYYDLQRVIRVFGDFRPWTVGAMDGAAARGRLDIMQWLNTNRTEGCSVEAFTGAVSNGHLHVLRWLCDVYLDLFDRTRELATAVSHRQPEVAAFLRRGATVLEDMRPFLQTAAELGFADVFECLLPGPREMTQPFLAAVRNGHAQVVRVMLDRSPGQFYVNYREGLNAVANSDHVDVAAVLIGNNNLSEFELAGALEQAVQTKRREMASFFLENRTEKSPSYIATGKSTRLFRRTSVSYSQGALNSLFVSVAKTGSVEMVKLLVEEISDCFGKALEAAVSNKQLEVVKVLLDVCKERKLKDSELYYAIGEAAAKAVKAHNIEMATLPADSCPRFDGSRALIAAAMANDLEAVKLFVTKSSRSSIAHGIFHVTRNSQADILEVLLEHSDQKTIQQALKNVSSEEAIGILPSDKKTEAAKMLLEKRDPAACAPIFTKAAADGRTEMMQQMLDTVNSQTLTRALATAVTAGKVDVVKVLLDTCDKSSIAFAIETAAFTGQVAVVELLRSKCSASAIRNAVTRAKAAGHDEVVQVLQTKRARLA